MSNPDEKKTKGFVLWFTGLPCSGKTTLSDAVAGQLKKLRINVEQLDGDIVRKSFSSDLGYSKSDRDENIRRITYVMELLARNDVAVLVSFISPYREKRDSARSRATNFIEVFVDCPLEVCEKRDVKGMYKKARNGEIADFTGVSDPYEIPGSPELVIYSEKESVEESVEKIMDYLYVNGFIEKEG